MPNHPTHGVEYKKFKISNGIKCQRWDSNSPHESKGGATNPDNFPEKNLESAGNYCRNPSPTDSVSPWCYTVDPDKRLEYCSIKRCGGGNRLKQYDEV